MFVLHIETDNAAFDESWGGEVARILRKVAHEVEGERGDDRVRIPLLDINGNRVGTAEWQ